MNARFKRFSPVVYSAQEIKSAILLYMIGVYEKGWTFASDYLHAGNCFWYIGETSEDHGTMTAAIQMSNAAVTR